MKIQGCGEEKDKRSCVSVAPFLTALFDGEADEDAARAARAHLLSCERCARTWLSWNQHRAALRNDSVPAPPPNLLWRVLLACRLSASSRHTAHSPSEVAAPADLKARILSQTTQHNRVKNGNSSRIRFCWNWTPAFAAPALAAWLLLFNRDTLAPPTHVSTNTSRPTSNAQPIPARAHSRAFVDETTARISTQTSPLASSTKAVPVLRETLIESSPAPFREKTSSEPADFAAPERPIPAPRAVVWEEPALAPRPSNARFVSLEQIPTRRRDTPVRLNPTAKRLNIARIERSNSRITSGAKPVLPAAPRARLISTETRAPQPSIRAASLSDSIETPRVRLATPRLRFTLAQSRTLRARVDEAALRVSQPRARGIQVVAFTRNDEEIDEEHIDDLRGVVDEFRAALSEDSLD